MRVSPLPSGASQPHQFGVRLGKCQASRKVKVCDCRGAMVSLSSTTPTALRCPGSGPSSPFAENASQKSIGEFHHRPCGHPRQCDTRTPGAVSPASATVPRIGSFSDKDGLLIVNPAILAFDWYVFCRGSFFRPDAGGSGGPTAFTGFSSDHAILTFALTLVGFVTRYRRIATGRPESSGSCGIKGE